MLDPKEFLESSLSSSIPSTIKEGGTFTAADQAKATSKKSYREAYGYLNVTSNSQQDNLHNCPRFWRIEKLPLPTQQAGFLGDENLDFAFGHAVGAGVQAYLATLNKQAALFACFLSWNVDYFMHHEKKMKSAPEAALAVLKFINYWNENWADEWEIATFNGKPATEYTFFIDAENGFFHAGHIDVILRHKITGHYLILELKTTSMKGVDEALYANSGQALGYSVVLDKLVDNLDEVARYEVLYMAYSSTSRGWQAFPFTKTRSQRVEWLQDLLLDHTTINTYHKLRFFPKRGSNCVKFNRRCKYFGLCDMTPQGFGLKEGVKDFKWYQPGNPETPDPEQFDFVFKLSEITGKIIQEGKQTKETIQNETRRNGRKRDSSRLGIWARKSRENRNSRPARKEVSAGLLRLRGRRYYSQKPNYFTLGVSEERTSIQTS